MQALIVEDEELAARKLRHLIEQVEPSITIAGVTASIGATVDWIRTNPSPDLIFMDIELADGQSFEIFKQVEISSTVIFTTSYDEYALQAFKVNSIDYLLKPIQQEDLRQSLEKLRRLTAAAKAPAPVPGLEELLRGLRLQEQAREYRQRFLVRQGQRLLSVEVTEAAYFYTEERVSFFRGWANQRFALDYNLDEIERMLDPSRFFRINRSIILSHRSVEQMQPYFGNRLALQLKPATDREVIVSREKVMDFKRWMGK